MSLFNPTSTIAALPARLRWQWPRRVWWIGSLGVFLIASVLVGKSWWDQHPAVQEVTLNVHRWPQTSANTRPDGHLRVLFIGNSLTQYNGGLPLIMEQLCASTGMRPVPIFDMVYRYGATWAQIWDTTPARNVIEQGNWDYVVLQDHSTAGMKYRSEMDVYARRFSRLIYSVGARPVFFMTWPHGDQLSDQRTIASAYANVTAANNGILAPVGLAWERVRRERPRFDLYDPRDNPTKHPNAAGSYLAGCVFYSVLFHKSPHGCTGRIAEGSKVYIDLKPKDALYLQDTAWKTVMGPLATTRPVGR
jgi:hypothetical protein